MAATLKLNRNIPQHTKSKRIDDIIVQLSLEKIVNTVIGDVEKKGISGTCIVDFCLCIRW